MRLRTLAVSCLAASVLFIVGCHVPPPPNALATGSGFSPEGGAVHFGSEASVDLVKGIDSAWAEMDMDRLANFFSDTAKFDWYDGKSYDGVDAFIGRIMEDTLDNEWDFQWAYSLDANVDEPGNWVHAGFDVHASQDGEPVEHAWYQEWYYIEDGKVSYWYNTKAIRND
jgi:hypothetical protein|tara:strand:+ start:3358 stop:3864 length:507 start_codon:yes stop_codon:yes gene_type:complete